VSLSAEIHSCIEASDEALVARLPARKEYAIVHDAYEDALNFLRAQHRYAEIKIRQKHLPLSYLLTAPIEEFIVRSWKGHHLGWFGFGVAALFALARVFDGFENIRYRLKEESTES